MESDEIILEHERINDQLAYFLTKFVTRKQFSDTLSKPTIIHIYAPA